MYQNGIKISKSLYTWGRKGASNAGRISSPACLHCKRAILQSAARRGYSSNIDAPPKGHPIRNTLVLLGLTTGAVVGYAKFDPDFRKQVEDISPAFNELIKIVAQEERSYDESFAVISNYVSSLYKDLVGETTSVPVPEPKKPSLPAPPSPKPVPQRSEAKPVTKSDEVVPKSTTTSIPPPPPPTAKPPAVAAPKKKVPAPTPGQFDDDIRVAAKGAILSLQDAIVAVKGFSEEVGKVLDSEVNHRDAALWDGIRNKTAQKDKLVSTAEKAAADAAEKLSVIRASLESSAVSVTEKDRVRRILSAATSEVESARRELEGQKQRGSLTDRYWNKVEDARRHFQDEIQALFPNAKITDKKLEASDIDLDLFLTHVFKHVVFYQRELAHLEVTTEQELRRVLGSSGEAVNEQVLEVRVKQAVEKEKRRLEEQLQRKLLVARSEQEREVGAQLKRQLETAHDHLNDVLSAKEADLDRRVARKLDERDAAERVDYDTRLATMLSQLKALQVVLTERIEADRNAHEAHVLFSACQALFRALRSGVAGSHWTEQLRPLNPELSAVSGAVGDKDSLVSVVLSSVPAEARTRGVYPETALRERFLRVEQVARRVALVPETGGSLYRYLVSYLQSALLLPSAPIPTGELRDEAVDVSKLDTYDLLQRARYWVDRGDLKMSLRYMNLLRGASRAVASQWMDETRIYLETQLIVTTLMAHAAATGMLYL